MKNFYRLLGFIMLLSALFDGGEITAQSLKMQSFTTGYAIAGGSLDGDLAESVAIDEEGNRYVTGYFEGTLDFDPGAGISNITSMGRQDLFIAKYSASGDLIWVQGIGGTSDDKGTGIAVNAEYVYVSGRFYEGGPVTIGGTTLTSAGGWDMMVLKINQTDGSIVWAKSYGTAGTTTNTEDVAYGIASDNSGNIYLTGVIGSTINGSNGTVMNFDGIEITIAGQIDAFIAKLDASGTAQWVKGIGGNLNATGFSITVAGDFVYTAGNFAGSDIDFNRGATPAFLLSANGFDGFITKHHLDGTFQWAAKVGGTTNDDAVRSIAIDADDNVFSTGYFNSTNVDFGNSVSLTSSGTDAFVWKMNPEGTTQWATKMSSIGSVMGYGIAVNARGDIYTSGTFEGASAVFGNGFSLTSKGMGDVFIAKMNPVGNTVWAESFGGTLADYSKQLVIHNNEEVITAGGFLVSINLDPDNVAADVMASGLTDLFLHSFTPIPSGSGTEADPYLISNIDELEWIVKSTDRWNKHYKQIQPIDASHTQYWNNGAGWIPIGNETVKFTGTYDGNNLIIADLFLDRPATQYNGLFGYTENASLTGIGLVNMNIRGGSDEHFTVATYDGGLVGYASATAITDCYTTGSIRGYNTVGGLAGSVASGSKVDRSYSSSVVGGTENLGGFIGSITDSEVALCYSTGYVVGTKTVGGFAGHNNGTIANCYVFGSDVIGTTMAAGFAGYSDGVITRSYSNATLLGDSKNGFAADGVSNITNSFWDVDTDGIDTSAENDVSVGAIGKTSEQLKTLQTFLSAEWDFKDGAGNDIWNIGNGRNTGYPYFNWQFTDDIGFQFITFEAPAQKTYGDAEFQLSASITSGLEITFGSSNPLVATISGQTVTIKGAGQTTITASQAGNDDYLPAEDVEQVLVIVPKPLYITAIDKEKIYGQTDPDFDVAYATFAYEETFAVLTGTLVLNHEAGEDVGFYPITPSGLTSANYDITFVAGQLEITPAALTVKATDDTKIYGQSDPEFAVTYDGFQFTDEAASLGGEMIFDRESNENVGSYAVTPSGLTSANYDITFVAGQLEITPAALTVKATDDTKIYGQSDPEFAVTYDGFQFTDEAASLGGELIFDRESGENVGSYAVTPSGLTSDNYDIAFEAGQLEITHAALTVKANDDTKIYGQSDPEFAVTYDGFRFTDDAASLGGELKFDRESNENVGSYAVAPSGLTSANYDITFETGQLEITPAALTIIADSDTKVYGFEMFFDGTELSVVGLVEGDEVTTATVSSVASLATTTIGEYAVNVTDAVGTGLTNYNITYEAGTITIIPRTVTISGTFTVADKFFDGTTNAVIEQNNLVLNTIVNNDPVTLANLVVEFESSAPGADIPVVIVSAELSGEKKENYMLSLADSPATTASITDDTSVLTAESEKILLYPNPARDVVTLQTSIPARSVVILDITGRSMYSSQEMESDLIRINLSGLPSGLYLVKIQTEAGEFIKKLQLQR
jgi:hypothetical protein